MKHQLFKRPTFDDVDEAETWLDGLQDEIEEILDSCTYCKALASFQLGPCNRHELLYEVLGKKKEEKQNDNVL